MRKNFQLLTLFIITALFSSVIFAKKHATCDEYYSGKSLEHKASRFKGAINHAAKKHGVNRDFIKAVITVESCFRPNARGSLGEKGLMQLMPATARKMGVRNGYNSWQNIDGGTRYLKYLLHRYNGNKHYAAAAYNGGPGAVSQTTGPRFAQVRRYSRHVMRAYHKMSKASDVVSQPVKKSSKNKKVIKPQVISKLANKSKRIYRVKKGQTLFRISRLTGISVKRLTALNRLSSAKLEVGQVLQLEEKSSKIITVKLIKSKRKHLKTKRQQKKSYHVVDLDQTLYSIARENGISVQRLKRLNQLKSASIKVGQRLRLK